MSEINVRDARRHFKALLDRVAAGEEVVLLRHGKPVARLVPPEAGAPERLPDLSDFRASMAIREGSLRDAVIAERREARY